MKLIPLVDQILIEAVQAEKVTASWIILPTDDKEKPSKWIVVALPKDGKYTKDGIEVSIDLVVWDTVYFTKYAPDELEIDGKTYLVVKHSSLLAKVSH